MLPAPRSDIVCNTLEYENLPLVKPTGFREYDARWLFFREEKDGTLTSEINLLGMRALGLGLGTFLHERGHGRRVYRPRHRSRPVAHGLFRPVRP